MHVVVMWLLPWHWPIGSRGGRGDRELGRPWPISIQVHRQIWLHAVSQIISFSTTCTYMYLHLYMYLFHPVRSHTSNYSVVHYMYVLTFVPLSFGEWHTSNYHLLSPPTCTMYIIIAPHVYSYMYFFHSGSNIHVLHNILFVFHLKCACTCIYIHVHAHVITKPHVYSYLFHLGVTANTLQNSLFFLHLRCTCI